MIYLLEIKTESDLLPPGSNPGTIPTDIEQATGLERLEILGKMQGVDVFDMKPLDASRLGTIKDPIVVKSAGDEQYVGCTGCPADSHVVLWITVCVKISIQLSHDFSKSLSQKTTCLVDGRYISHLGLTI